jgi:hypothetical protein
MSLLPTYLVSVRGFSMKTVCGNVAGVAAPAITGFIIGATGHFDRAFLSAAP